MAQPFHEVQISRAQAADGAAAQQIIDEYCEAIGVMVRDTPEAFAHYFAEDSGIWLARVGDEVVGCVALRPLPLVAVDGACEVKRLYVKPAFRGRQISQLLMAALHEYATERGYKWCYLDSKDDLRAAIVLYERLGYEACERYNQNPQATVFMRRALG